jgi:hypothetical protein
VAAGAAWPTRLDDEVMRVFDVGAENFSEKSFPDGPESG